MESVIYCITAIICVGLLCFKGIRITHVQHTVLADDDTRNKMKEVFEVANDTDTEKDPTYKDVMIFIDETFGGDDYGSEPTETTED